MEFKLQDWLEFQKLEDEGWVKGYGKVWIADPVV